MVDLLPRRIQNLSGGQKQRVGIGRAIVREPRLFIMDEPISHLEAQLRADMRTELKRLHRRLGVTTLYVTHDQLEAVALADRIAVMDLGVLQQVGTPAELFDQPANEFVAGFIGSPPMNMLHFRSASLEGEDLLLEGAGPAIRIPAIRARLSARDRRRRAQAGDTSGRRRARAAGGRRHDPGRGAVARAAGRPRPFPDRLRRRAAWWWRRRPRSPAQPGRSSACFFPRARVHLFEGASGRRLFVPDRAARAA